MKKYYYILYKMSYQSYSVSLTEGQKANLARAYKNRSPITIRLKNDKLKGNIPLLLTKTQINRIDKADKTGVDVNISKTQMSAQSKNKEFLGALVSFLARTILPTVTRTAPKVVAPLATGALSGLASTGVSKIFGNGLILPVSPAKQRELLNKAGPYFTNAQINQMLKSNKLKLTKKQSQFGGILPLSLGALGSLAAPVLGSLFDKGLRVEAQQRLPRGKGLQVDAQQRPYRRVPRVTKKKKKKKKKKNRNKPTSNFDFMNWVKELKIT